MQIMTKEQAQKREEYLAKLRPMSCERFQHFATEQQKQSYLEGVKHDQESKSVPF